MLVPLDAALAQQAVAIAAQQRLRGSDAVYGAVAVRFGTTLVTRDREQRDRLTTIIPAVEPGDLLHPQP
jgi:predicted nucleic acid-binding protein